MNQNYRVASKKNPQSKWPVKNPPKINPPPKMEKNNFGGFFYRPIFLGFFYRPPSTSLISARNQKKVNTHISFYPATIPSVSYFLIKITSLFIHPSLYSSICMSTPVSVFPQQCHQNFTQKQHETKLLQQKGITPLSTKDSH